MAPPPPGPTLCALLERLSTARAIYLGAYSSTALLRRDGDRFELFALFGAVLGVSPVDDRMPQMGERIFEADGIDDLIGNLVIVWTSDYGALLAANEQLSARMIGDRRLLMIELRKRWPGGLSLADAPNVLDGKRALDQKEAKAIVETAQATGARIEWRCVRG
jgi:hypothetical protein